ncbi:MAG: PHP domain-containing protein [Spirochaetales bacterium]|jgi:hypothetical protein|nr:PHP domain-containing protein [Spirochaetales bacterium]
METQNSADLIRELNAASAAGRLAAAERLGELIEAGELKRTISGELNNHVHTWYSFSPYSPSKAAYMAWNAGLLAVGIMDHDSASGCEEMLDAAKSIGIAATVGFELRVNMTGTGLEGRKINNPDSENIVYIAVHGIPRGRLADAVAFLEPVRQARNSRNRGMVDRMNRITESWKIGILDFDRDISPSSLAVDGGSITERHILFSLAEKVVAHTGRGEPLLDFLESSANLNISGRVREYLLDVENPHYEYDLLGVFKSTLISDIYIQPADDECVGVVSALEFAKSIGAIPAYAYLGDVTDSPTGDKKAAKFEDDYLEELFKELKTLGFQAVTYMPPRNTREQLTKIQELCGEYELMEISGVDINSSRQSFNCPELLLNEYKHLAGSAWGLIAHEKLADADNNMGIFHPNNPYADLSLKERIRIYGAVGAAIDPKHTEESPRVAAMICKELGL